MLIFKNLDNWYNFPYLYILKIVEFYFQWKQAHLNPEVIIF